MTVAQANSGTGSQAEEPLGGCDRKVFAFYPELATEFKLTLTELGVMRVNGGYAGVGLAFWPILKLQKQRI